MKVAVTGASGLIGSALVPALRRGGHQVLRLVRRPPQAADEAAWDPAAGQVDVDAMVDVDAVINLAGVGIGDHRWTPAYKAAVAGSRQAGTSTIARALAALASRDARPRTLLSGSAVGFYGDTDSREVDEDSPSGTGFLADTCVAWEQAADAAVQAGVRTVHLRSGIVLSRDGGALGKVLPVFRAGLGGKLGSGHQYFSWISRDDHVAATLFLLSRPELTGPFNLTAPQPVTNAVYTQALGAALRRPAVMVVPAFALRLALGEFADEGLLVGQRVLPRRLTETGFTFAHPDIGSALSTALG